MTSETRSSDRPSNIPAHFRVNTAALRGSTGAFDGSIESTGVMWIAESAVLGVRLQSGPADVEIRVRRSESGFAITGTATAGWEGECRRCLEPVTGALVAEIDEEVVTHGAGSRLPIGDPSSSSSAAEDEDPAVQFMGDVIDVSTLVRENLVFALPMAPLCSEDCGGPDPEDYPISPEADTPISPASKAFRLAPDLEVELESGIEEPPPSGSKVLDPRWAALSDFEAPDES